MNNNDNICKSAFPLLILSGEFVAYSPTEKNFLIYFPLIPPFVLASILLLILLFGVQYFYLIPQDRMHDIEFYERQAI